MKRKVLAGIAGALTLCMLAAGCGAQSGNTGTDQAESAATAATAAATAQAAEEADDEAWKEEDDAYLTGVTASDYVELPEEYRHLTVEAEKPVDPTDEDVETRIETELSNHTTVEEVDRAVEEGDTVNIDFVGKIDGEEFDGGSGSYDLEIGSGTFIEGFEEGLIGAKKGETLDLELTFPEDYHADEGLAGQDVVFTVTVNTISESSTPELNDDFVRSLNLTNAFGQAVTSVEDYEDYIRSNLIEEREDTYENTVKSMIVSQLVQDSSFQKDAPENMVEKYNYLLTRQLNYYALQMYTDLQGLMSAYYGATEENYLDMIRDMAVSYAQQGLVFQAVADKEDLNPDEDAVNKALTEYVESDSTVETVEDLERLIRESLRDELMTDNVVDWLYDHCKVKEPEEEEETADTSEDAAEASTEDAADAESAEDADTAETAESADTAETAESADTGETSEEAENAAEGETADSAARHEN